MNLILLRHGQSEWNLENRFTGWTDVCLTQNGIEEAKFSGNTLLEHKFNIKSITTSKLERAIHTAHIVSDIINFPRTEIQYKWRINERHYGALQGLNKSETAKKYGENQVKIWRRSYNVPPPQIDSNDERHPKFNTKFKNILDQLPVGESLQDVIERIKPFWKKYVNNIIQMKGDHLIVAHSNSLRAIVKILDELSDNEIISVNIPTGVPLAYNLDNSLNVLKKEFLIDKNKLEQKLEIIANQGKAN